MKRLIYHLSIITVLLTLSSCSAKDKDENEQKSYYRITTEAELDSIQTVFREDPDNIGAGISLLSYLAAVGRLDEASSLSHRICDIAKKDGDEMTMHIARTYTALSHIMQNRLDSIRPYLNSVEYISSHDTTTFFSILANNAAAIYAMKDELDYSKALEHLQKALNVAVRNNDIFNQSVILNNISSIYLIREDTAGVRYAREAFSAAQATKQPYNMINSALALANMMLLENKFEEAISYADTAAYYEDSWKIKAFENDIFLTKAAARTGLGDFTGAEKDFSKARKNLSDAAPDTQTRYFMEYGNCLMSTGRIHEAVKMFTDALESDGCTHENRQALYLKLSDAYLAIGDAASALNCYKQYHKSSDSLSISQKERDFNALLMQYEQTRYEKQLSDKELTIEQNSRHATIVISILAVISIAAFCVSVTYRKKNLMYRNLVGQHLQYMEKKKQLNEEIALTRKQDDSKDRELFSRIESLMNNDKAYCNKEISLDLLAEMLSSNRSYISKVINKYSGQSFSSYINSKRIEEATRILSDPSDDTPLKALSDSLGYGTLSTFYRAFQKETGCPPSKYRNEVKKIRSSEKE